MKLPRYETLSRLMGCVISLAKVHKNVTSNVHNIQCTICSKIEGKDKIFVCKLDNLLKHASKCKVKVASRGVEIVSFYFNPKIQHAHN
jgi:hypothetical protein